MLLYQILAFTKHKKNIKRSYKDNKFNISASTWNEEFELLNGFYSISDIQDYLKYIIKCHDIVTDNLPIRISVKKKKNTFRIKTLHLE